MPEALAILAVFATCAAIFVYAWLQARDPANHNPTEALADLKHRLHWLDDRLKTAETERWSPEMVSQLHEQRATALAELSRMNAPAK